MQAGKIKDKAQGTNIVSDVWFTIPGICEVLYGSIDKKILYIEATTSWLTMISFYQWLFALIMDTCKSLTTLAHGTASLV